MSRVILLLPSPDVLQLANCHKHVARAGKGYKNVYTTSTITGKCANVDKILVIRTREKRWLRNGHSRRCCERSLR